MPTALEFYACKRAIAKVAASGEPGVFEKIRDIEEWREKHQAQHATAVRFVKDALLNRGTARALAWIVGAALAALGVGGGLALWQ